MQKAGERRVSGAGRLGRGEKELGKGKAGGSALLSVHPLWLSLRLSLLVGRELAGVHFLADKPFDDKRIFFHFPFTFDLWPG